MYIVKIKNGSTETEIHNENIKLSSGQIVKGINTIDSFSFSVLPNNPAFNNLNDFQTFVTVYNTIKEKYEFYGRVLYSTIQMSDKGLLKREVTCESYFGFLCDSVQTYVEEKNWTVEELFTHIITTHNKMIEYDKHFKVGEIRVTAPRNNVYIGIQRENTWETLTKKLIEKLGGEIRFRVEEDGIYIDYLKKIGTEKTTAIAISKNMKSITKENDPSSFVTRLIPLGAKLNNDTEERLTIASIINGVSYGNIYIDDTEAIRKYGIHAAYKEFDDITTVEELKTAGENWLKENNKVLIKYSITALDLSLIGLDVDDFEIFNSYPIKNSLLGIDDVARISKQTIDICDETKKSFEIGDSFKTLTELQREQMKSLSKYATISSLQQYATKKELSETNGSINIIAGNYVTQSALTTVDDKCMLLNAKYDILSKYTRKIETIEKGTGIAGNTAETNGYLCSFMVAFSPLGVVEEPRVTEHSGFNANPTIEYTNNYVTVIGYSDTAGGTCSATVACLLAPLD